MGRVARGLALGLLAAVVLAAGLAAHTWWARPLSIDWFFLRVVARFGLESPMLLSQLRLLEPLGIDFHQDDLDDFSPGFTDARAERLRRDLATLRGYDRASLSPADRRSYDVMEWFLRLFVEGEPFRFHDYPVNQMDGVQSRLPDFMINVHPLTDRAEARDYVARLARFGPALDQVLDAVRHRADLGVVPPRFVLLRVREEVAGFTAPEPAANPLVTHLEEALAGLALPAEERAALAEAARREVADTVYPAYARLDALLASLEASATDEDGVWKLPDGDAYYAWALRFYTTTDTPPDELHRIGLEETRRIQDEIRLLLEGEGMDVGDLSATLLALHADPAHLFPRNDEGRRLILEEYRAILADALRRLPDYFGLRPESPVVVERVPVFKEDGSPVAYYRPPAMDGSRPGVFYANLRDPAETARFGMRTLTYHEAVPGHHLQIGVALENGDLPLFRRLVPFVAFGEGWALYSERLAAEEGWHPTALDRVGQLVAELFRAVRLVVDTGIHSQRWTREEAIAYMRANTGMAESEVVAEVERYIVLPGQACAYKVGQLAILGLRDRARQALGERFDYRDFHDAVLGGGSLPLELLEPAVEEWLLEATRP